MKKVYSAKELGLDLSKKIYECYNCKKMFNWDENSSWYGSIKQMENNPKLLKFACSDKCQLH